MRYPSLRSSKPLSQTGTQLKKHWQLSHSHTTNALRAPPRGTTPVTALVKDKLQSYVAQHSQSAFPRLFSCQSQAVFKDKLSRNWGRYPTPLPARLVWRVGQVYLADILVWQKSWGFQPQQNQILTVGKPVVAAQGVQVGSRKVEGGNYSTPAEGIAVRIDIRR